MARSPALIRAAIFDWGGVLCHTELYALLDQWDRRLGLPPGAVLTAMFRGTDHTVLVGRITAEEHWAGVCRALPLSAENRRQVIRELAEAEVFDAELGAFIRSLRPRLRTAILTNQWSDGRALLNQHGAERLVDELIISAEVGAAKPEPEIYWIALERLAVDPEEAIFVDDDERNVAAASAVGLHSVLYASTPQAIAEVRQLV